MVKNQIFLPRKLNLVHGHDADVVDEVAGLVLVPPAQRLGGHADLRERRQGALDLNRLSAVRERERQVAVEQDFHA